MLSLTLLGDNVCTDTMSPCRHTGAFIGGGAETRAHGVTSSHAGREDYISSNISSAVRSKEIRGAGGSLLLMQFYDNDLLSNHFFFKA